MFIQAETEKKMQRLSQAFDIPQTGNNPHLLGSNAESILRYASVPVLVIR